MWVPRTPGWCPEDFLARFPCSRLTFSFLQNRTRSRRKIAPLGALNLGLSCAPRLEDLGPGWPERLLQLVAEFAVQQWK